MLPEESGEFFCPVTGRKWESRPEWVLTATRCTFRFYVLDRSIVMCRTFGSTGAEEVELYGAALQKIVDEFHEPGHPMVLLEDYSHLHGTDRSGRNAYTGIHLDKQHLWKGILFFGVNPFLKLIIRLSKRLLPIRIPIEAYGEYAPALEQAFRLLDWSIEPMAHPESANESGWKSESLAVTFSPLDSRRVLRVQLKGRLVAADLPELFRAYEEFLASQSPPPHRWYRLIDYSDLTGVELRGLRQGLQNLRRIDRLFPPRARFVVGALHGVLPKAVIGWMRFTGRIEVVQGESALEARVAWYEARHDAPAANDWIARLRPLVFRNETKTAHDLMAFIGELQWDVAGSGINPYGENHPLHQVAASLLVVKADFDALLLERDRRERDLEAARERAVEVNRLQARFLANVSHEIRTPLNAVLGMGELLADTPLDLRQQDLLRTLRQSAQGLLGVINDILDLSRMEAGEFQLGLEAFDLSSLLDEVGSMIGYLASTRGLDFRLERSPGLPRGLHGDSMRLRQILINLAGNAVKFTEAGNVIVRARSFTADGADKSRLILEVEDSGPGIPPEKIDELFRPFKQLDGTFTRRHGGTGLGLAIARNLAVRMGGDITVHAAPARGTIFRFETEFVHATVAPINSDPSQEVVRELSGCLLLAEDNRVNQKVALGLLAKLGVEAVAVDNGQKAVEMLAQHAERFRCVLMDIQMPVMDGLEAVRRIRAGEAGEVASRLPIFALTAHAMDGDRETFLEAGMDGYLSKPIRLASLRQILEGIMTEIG